MHECIVIEISKYNSNRIQPNRKRKQDNSIFIHMPGAMNFPGDVISERIQELEIGCNIAHSFVIVIR